MSRLIDADELRKDDEVTEWLSHDPIRTGKNLKMFSELFVKKIDNAPTIHAVPIEVLQEIRHEIETAQTYKIASGSHDLYIDRNNALEIIDSHIEQYKEDAE